VVLKLNDKEMSFLKKILKWIGIVFVALIIIGSIAGGNNDKNTEQTKQPDATQETSSSENTEKVTQENPKEKEETEPEEKFTKYKSGNYKVGTDLPAGEYKLFTKTMAYYEVTKDSSGNFDSIICNDNFSNFSYIKVEDGQYLKLQSCFAVPAAEAPAYEPTNGKYMPGKYKVGFDIPAGEYKVVSDGTMAYIEVSSNCLGTMDSIISNDNFENSKYITINDGNYFKMQGCYIDQ
jgi:preprotein translocase subunit SecG